MNQLKRILFATALSLTVVAASAQGNKTSPTKTEKSTTRTETKVTPAVTKGQTTATKTEKKIVSKTETKQAGSNAAKEVKPNVKAEKKPADARTKTGDKVDREKKGPHGETVYTGGRGGKYYLDKSGNHIYIK